VAARRFVCTRGERILARFVSAGQHACLWRSMLLLTLSNHQDCGGSQVCVHNRQKATCKVCFCWPACLPLALHALADSLLCRTLANHQDCGGEWQSECRQLVFMVNPFDRSKMKFNEKTLHPMHSVHVMDAEKLRRCRLLASRVSSLLNKKLGYERLMVKKCSDLERLRKVVSQKGPSAADDFEFGQACSCCDGL